MMTFILSDLEYDGRNLQLANRLWRPLAEEIRRANILAGDRAATLGRHLCTKVTKDEAIAISVHLSSLVLDGKLPKGIDREIAQQVTSFARASTGFEVC